MQKLIKTILIWTAPIGLLLFFIFFVNVLLTSFRFSHQSSFIYNGSYPWAKYYLTVPIKKFFINLTNNQELGLERKYIYLSEQSQRKLLSRTPKSTKYWVSAHILNIEDKIQKIKLRYRGDNPANWLFEKKHLRIKSKKKELFDRVRYFDYTPLNAETFSSAKISELMNLIVQKPKLIELYMNGKSNGVFVEYEKLNENFLRRNKLMPVNFYKGENHATERYIGIDENLFNNPGLWSKIAIFNKNKDEDKSDLIRFLSTLNKYEYSDSFEPTLDDYIDVKKFSKFSSFLTITQSTHHDYFHNMRLIIDPWSGNVNQVITDGAIYENVKSRRSCRSCRGKFSLDFSSNDLHALLHRSSVFNHEKYKWIYKHLYKDDIFEKYNNFYIKNKTLIETSSKRDPDNSYKEVISDFDKVNKRLTKNKNNLKKIFDSKLQSFWSLENKNLYLHIDGYMPVSDVKIIFDQSNAPKWVSVDTNFNNKADEFEPKYMINNSQTVNISAIFYANRFKHASSKTSMHRNNFIYNSSTKFKLIVENGSIPVSISGLNPFTKESFKIFQNNNIKSVVSNKYNKIIYNKNNIHEKVETISGEIDIDYDTVYTSPVNIMPGTKFNIKQNSHIIFKNKVIANGTKDKPIIFDKMTSNNSTSLPWGSLAIIGNKTKGSELTNIKISGGSGGSYKQYFFTSMLSLHNTQNINIKNILLENNKIYDDAIHIIYCQNITLDDIKINNAHSDAVDVDISKNITIKNSRFVNPKNDSLDFMESVAKVINTKIIGSGDKGISVGENSNIFIKGVLLKDNETGVAIKDKSITKITKTKFENNKIQISAYSKNFQYGGGGKAKILDSYLTAKINRISSSNKSLINIKNSVIVGEKIIEGTTVTIN